MRDKFSFTMAASLLAFLGPGALGQGILSAPAFAAPSAFSASDGAEAPAETMEAALAEDSLVIVLGGGEEISLFGLEARATESTKLFVTLSSEYLTAAVASGRLEASSGQRARAGDALVLQIDGGVVSRMAFDAERLSASNSPGAASLLATELTVLSARQRRLRFWGYYEPTGINAAAPSSPALEALRRSYLDPLIIARQRRAAPEARFAQAANDFLAALGSGNQASIAAMLDPAPFLARVGGPEGLAAARAQAAARIAADAELQASLGQAPSIELAPDNQSARIAGADGAWRLSLVARDRVVFIAGLEPEIQ
jgi:hypothetical protein